MVPLQQLSSKPDHKFQLLLCHYSVLDGSIHIWLCGKAEVNWRLHHPLTGTPLLLSGVVKPFDKTSEVEILAGGKFTVLSIYSMYGLTFLSGWFMHYLYSLALAYFSLRDIYFVSLSVKRMWALGGCYILPGSACTFLFSRLKEVTSIQFQDVKLLKVELQFQYIL